MAGQISQSTNVSSQQSSGQQQATSFIPEYSQTPILQSIAQYAQQMAPVVYQWGMDQYTKNQGDIDQMMRAARMYGSPQRVKAEMGQAEAGVAQAGEQARQSAMRDLQSYGIDPSSGRYAALDQASRVQTAAAAAGAGNQQRMATEAAGNAMQNQALSASLQNVGLGYGASQAMTNLLGTGMQLKYPPLGTTSQGYNTSVGMGSGQSSSVPDYSGGGGSGGGGGRGGGGLPQTPFTAFPGPKMVRGGQVPEPTRGGFVSHELSPSGGDHTDDVNARLNAGEFVIPKDIVQWKGKEFFAKLIAQSRKARAVGDGEQQQEQSNGTGYQAGGPVMPSRGTMVTPPSPSIPGYAGTMPGGQYWGQPLPEMGAQ